MDSIERSFLKNSTSEGAPILGSTSFNVFVFVFIFVNILIFGFMFWRIGSNEEQLIEQTLRAPEYINVEIARERSFDLGFVSRLFCKQGVVSRYYLEGVVATVEDFDNLAIEIEKLDISTPINIDVEVLEEVEQKYETGTGLVSNDE